MTIEELYILKDLALHQHEEFHDGLKVLLNSDKSLYKAFQEQSCCLAVKVWKS